MSLSGHPVGIIANAGDRGSVLELAHYPLDDNLATKGIVDVSGNGYDLMRVVANTGDRSPTGKVGRAQSFVSTGERASRSPLPNGASGAVMAWCSFTPSAGGQTVMSQRIAGSSNVDYILATADSVGNVRFQGTFDSTLQEIATSTPPSGTFHVAVVWAAGVCTMYINAVSVESFSYVSYTPAEAAGVLFSVGGRDYAPELYLGGWIDDVRVYNTPIPSSAVAKIYNNGNGTSSPLHLL